MKKLTNKKAFTLVEIIVVIVIVGVLASVIITGYTGYIAKANKVSDISITKQMNDHLAVQKAVDGENKTYTDMKEDLEEIGITIDKLQPRSKEYTFAWDSVNDKMVMLDKNDNIVEPREQNGTSVADKKIQYFVVVQNKNDFENMKNNGYSIYLEKSNSFIEAELTDLSSGLDVGENKDIKKISYKNTGTKKTVLLRTNGGNLEIDAQLDDVHHYGNADTVTIKRVAMNSYHLYGTVMGKLELESGRVEVESTGKVSIVNVTATSPEAFDISNTKGGTINLVTATDSSLLKTTGDDKNVTVGTQTGVMTPDNNNAIVHSSKSGFIENQDDLTNAFKESTNITLLKDIELTGLINIDSKKEISIDLNGKTILKNDVHVQTVNNVLVERRIKITNGSKLELYNGNINFIVDDNDSSSSAITVMSASSITLRNIEYTTTGAALFPRGDAAKVVVENSTIKAPKYGVGTNASVVENYNVNIELRNSTFEAETPILINVPGTLLVENCIANGTKHGIVVRGGTATIRNCKINQTEEYTDNSGNYDTKNWGSGNDLPYGGVIIGNKSGAYQYLSNVKLENNEITTKGGLPAIYVHGNTAPGKGVILDHMGNTGGEPVKGNNYCIINGVDYRTSDN